MKKLLFSTLFLLGMTVNAIAQSTSSVWYNAFTDKEHKNYFTHYFMDRKNMEFHFDWDSDNEMLIKNYVKKGNTETFDTYYKDEPSKKFARIVLVIDDKNPENSKITINIVEQNAPQENYYIKEKVDEKSNEKSNEKGDIKAPSAPSANEANVDGGTKSIKDNAKSLLNKGKNLFKKKNNKWTAPKKSSNASADNGK